MRPASDHAAARGIAVAGQLLDFNPMAQQQAKAELIYHLQQQPLARAQAGTRLLEATQPRLKLPEVAQEQTLGATVVQVRARCDNAAS